MSAKFYKPEKPRHHFCQVYACPASEYYCYGFTAEEEVSTSNIHAAYHAANKEIMKFNASVMSAMRLHNAMVKKLFVEDESNPYLVAEETHPHLSWPQEEKEDFFDIVNFFTKKCLMANKNMLNSREFGVGLLSKNVFYENMTSSTEQHFYVNFAFYNKKEEKLTLCFYPGYLQHRPLLYYKMAVLAVMDYFTANTSLDMGNLETIEILYTEPHGLTPKNEYSTKESIKLKNHRIFIRQYSDAETMLTLTHQDYMSLKNKSYVGSLSKTSTDYLITNGYYTPSVRNCSICLGKSICPAAENNAKEDFHANAKN